jgi:hypothetical protein
LFLLFVLWAFSSTIAGIQRLLALWRAFHGFTLAFHLPPSAPALGGCRRQNATRDAFCAAEPSLSPRTLPRRVACIKLAQAFSAVRFYAYLGRMKKILRKRLVPGGGRRKAVAAFSSRFLPRACMPWPGTAGWHETGGDIS